MDFHLFDQDFPQIQELGSFFKAHPRMALGFSGGCDSAFLLEAAVQAGVDIHVFMVKSRFQPKFEFESAKEQCARYGLDCCILEFEPDEQILNNPANRCYFCKLGIFGLIKTAALKLGISCICDGTNASDDIADRPGWKALQELGVLSPLRSCGLTKPLIRHLSGLCGLGTAHKPAYACLATRFPVNERITAEMLDKVENAESALFELGFDDFRVRLFHGAARLELTERDLSRAAKMYAQIRQRLSAYFDTVLIDTAVRKSE